MSRSRCTHPVPLATLLEYWLDELGEAEEEPVELHLLACSSCSAHLQALVDLGAEIRTALRSGALHAAVPGTFVERLAAEGLRLRTYRVPPGDSVYCTVAPEDDLLITCLGAPLADVERIDVVQMGQEGTVLERLSDVPFDSAAGEVVLTSRMERVRALPASTLRYRLIAVAPSGERLLGEYTFHHTPAPSADPA